MIGMVILFVIVLDFYLCFSSLMSDAPRRSLRVLLFAGSILMAAGLVGLYLWQLHLERDKGLDYAILGAWMAIALHAFIWPTTVGIAMKISENKSRVDFSKGFRDFFITWVAIMLLPLVFSIPFHVHGSAIGWLLLAPAGVNLVVVVVSLMIWSQLPKPRRKRRRRRRDVKQ